MQDNEFEKQVRDKLTGLKIDATNTVWDRVQESLHQKEKRRKWLIWLPVGLTGIILSAIFLSQLGTGNTDRIRQDRSMQPAYPSDNITGKKISGDSIVITLSKEKTMNTEGIASKNDKKMEDLVQQQPSPNRLLQGKKESDLPVHENNKPAKNPGDHSLNQETPGEKNPAGLSLSKQTHGEKNPDGHSLKKETPGEKNPDDLLFNTSIAEEKNPGNRFLNKHAAKGITLDDSLFKKNTPAGKNSQHKVSGEKSNSAESPNHATLNKNKEHREAENTAVLRQGKKFTRPASKNNDAIKPILDSPENPTSPTKKISEKYNQVKKQPGFSSKPGMPANEQSIAGTEFSSSKELYSSPVISLRVLEKIIAVNPGNYHSPQITPHKISKIRHGFAWGFEAGFGRSGITSGKLNNLFYSQAASISNFSAINLGSSGTVHSPSQVRPGLAFSAGAYIRQPLDESFYFKAGLGYDLFTTAIVVGTKMNQNIRLQSPDSRADKTIGSYYTSDRENIYINRYNFIDLPVSFGKKFARHSRLPFAWELGIAPGMLLASNALNYNQSSSIYYQDNSLFRKTQLQVFTALPVRFFNGKAYALEIVPSFKYISSSLFKPEFNERKHLLSAGLSVRANFLK